MIAEHHFERRELNNRARTLLAADGTLTGPALDAGEQSFQAGDTVIARAQDRSLRPEGGGRGSHVRNGTRGTVLEVRAEPGHDGLFVDFDRKVLRRACETVRIPFDDRPWLDLAYLAGSLQPETYRKGGRSLDDWMTKFNIENTARHNAAGDALATAELLLRLRSMAAAQGARGFKGLLDAAKQQKWLSGGH